MKGAGRLSLVAGLVVAFGGLGCDDDDNEPGGGAGGTGGTGGSINAMNPDGGGGRGGSGPSAATIAFNFDTDLQGFTFDQYQDPTPGAVTNLAAPRTGGGAGAPGGAGGAGGSAPDGGAPAPMADAGAPVPLGAPPTLEHDPTMGDPSPGSMKVTVPFTGFNQVVDAGRRLPIANVENWTGKTVRVKVRLSEGAFGGGAVLYVLTLNPPSPMYLYAASDWTPLQAGQWKEITLNLGTVPTADKIVGFGVQFGSGGPALPGGTFTPSTPVFHVDSLTD